MKNRLAERSELEALSSRFFRSQRARNASPTGLDLSYTKNREVDPAVDDRLTPLYARNPTNPRVD